MVGSLGRGTNESLELALLNGGRLEWLGNEVSCGVGMQRIDIMPSIILNDQRILIPVELKSVEASESNVVQIQRYVDWIEQYYIPNRQSDIQPVLIAKEKSNKQSESYEQLLESFRSFNNTNENRCHRLKYIEFGLFDNELEFKSISY